MPPKQPVPDFVRDHLRDLLGATILSVVDDGEPVLRRTYGLRLRRQDGTETIAWILRDPEGNGPGWLEKQEVKK